MDGSESYIPIGRNVFKDLKESAGTQDSITAAFMLYFILLVKRDWKNTLDTSLKFLLTYFAREARYKKILTNHLELLERCKLVKFTPKTINLNDIIRIHINTPKDNFVQIRCVNEEIIGINSPMETHNLLAVYCYIATKVHLSIKRARVSNESIAKELGLSITTVNSTIRFLAKQGLLHIVEGGFNKALTKRACNQYKVYDIDQPIDNDNYFKVKADYKGKKILQKDIHDPLVLSLLEEEDRENALIDIMKNLAEHSPVLLIGNYAELIRKEYEIHIWNISKSASISDLIEDYYGIITEKPLIISNISSLSKPEQSKLLQFMENNKSNIVLLSDFDNISPPLYSRMKFVLKSPINIINRVDFLMIHEAYASLEVRKKYSNYNEEVRKKFLYRKSPKTFSLENLPFDRSYNNSMIDSLISKTTHGKMYREVLLQNKAGW